MGKGNRLILLSSDDDDDWCCLSKSRSDSRLKSRSPGRSRNPRPAKRPRLSGSRSRSSKESSHVDEVRLSFDDFDEALNGFKVSSGPGCSKTRDLWVDKYGPGSLEELAVHKKKVEEVKLWLEERLSTSRNEFRNQVLLITGPAGVGKSATVHVIASSLGVKVCEWNAPIPTIWLEHMHNHGSGLQYTSKLDEFENFVERTRKYGFITSSALEGSKSPTILLIDDLPLTNGRHSSDRLQNCLLLLVRSSQIPTIILLTDYEKTDSAHQAGRSIEKLQLSLESAGACKVAFNPITKNSIKKTLLRICRLEHCNVISEEIDEIASASGGDIRHAITSLQLFSLKPEQNHQKTNSTITSSSAIYLRDEETALNSAISLCFGRDETLSLFHALGKFLHNKRETDNVTASVCSDIPLHEQFSRLPLKMDAPEKVLCQAHGQARPVADFLHENVLDFLSDEATEDAWSVSSYLADADLLLASFRGMLSRHNETENVLESAAASVAVRGVLYGNTLPLTSRWHAIRRPKLWQVEQSSARNKNEMMRQRSIYDNGSRVSKVSAIATEYTPALKWLGFRASGDQRAYQKPMTRTETESDRILDEEESEDEIEDW